MTVTVKFWGVRGSVPAPLTAADVEKKVREALTIYQDLQPEKRTVDVFIKARKALEGPFTYGGNTSCVEVRYNDQIFVLDMGTGLRPLGNFLFFEIFESRIKSINAHF